MAWEARLSAARKDATSLARISIDAVYYDTAAPDIVLHQKAFAFPTATANQEMRQAVIEEGQRAKKTFDRAVVLASAFPDGTTIAIP
jgi:hypothetical protein